MKVILGLLLPPSILLLDFKTPLYTATSNTERNIQSAAVGAIESEKPLLGDDCFGNDNLREMVDERSFEKVKGEFLIVGIISPLVLDFIII